jgi:hypothetical protein
MRRLVRCIFVMEPNPAGRLDLDGPEYESRPTENGAMTAITISAAAPVDDTELRDQPRSLSQISITKPRAARAEYDTASTKNPQPMTIHISRREDPEAERI